jgi:hypothetical protein
MCVKDSFEREKRWRRYLKNTKLNAKYGQREFGGKIGWV